jgi:hypothetical protein
MVQATRENFAAIGCFPDVFTKATIAADSGYHSRQTMEYIAASPSLPMRVRQLGRDNLL